MSNTKSTHRTYQPETIGVPPIYVWPPKPVKALKYLIFDLLYPLGFFLLGLAWFTWHFLTPSLESMATLEAGWIALLWLRNAALLILVAGSLHWYLHATRSQQDQYQLNRQPLGGNGDQFLWGNQVKDNMFWSIASGVSFWTGFEAITYWIHANDHAPITASPWYFIFCFYLLFIWSTTNFYWVHRLLHWQPIYRHAHALHHRNVDVGPWSGISMHPLEHLLYFSPFILWWWLPVHPVIIILTGLFQGLNPAFSHCGYDYVKIGKLKLKTGDWFHQLHHQYFNLNYGNIPTPFDKVFNSWHDGTKTSLEQQKARMREKR